MSRRLTNLTLPNPYRKFRDHTTTINGMTQYLKEILNTQKEIYEGIYEQLLITEYVNDSNRYLSIIELVRLQGP